MYKKLSKNFMLNFVDSFYKEFSMQISQFTDTFRVFPTVSVNTGNFDVASKSFWLDYGKKCFFIQPTLKLFRILEKISFVSLLRIKH
jgi:hypothetical protein